MADNETDEDGFTTAERRPLKLGFLLNNADDPDNQSNEALRASH